MPRIIGVLVSSLAVLGFVSMAGATPLSQKAPGVSTPDVLFQVDSKCRKVDGKLVGNCKKSGKKHRDDDDDDDDDDHHQKGKGKGQGKHEDSGLSECTIQTPNGGGGCKTGFKRVCEKMKSGKKCCGCVADPNAPKSEAKPLPPALGFCCVASSPSIPGSGTVRPCSTTEALARQQAQSQLINGKPPEKITCTGP